MKISKPKLPWKIKGPLCASMATVFSSSRWYNWTCEPVVLSVMAAHLWSPLVPHCFCAKSLPLSPSFSLHLPASSSSLQLQLCLTACYCVFYIDAASWAQENQRIIFTVSWMIRSTFNATVLLCSYVDIEQFCRTQCVHMHHKHPVQLNFSVFKSSTMIHFSQHEQKSFLFCIRHTIM